MRTAFPAGLLLLMCACDEEPRRVVSSATRSSAPAARVRFAGRVELAGALAAASTGSVFVTARARGARAPSLSRKYEIGDPAWSMLDGKRVLYFALNEKDDMDGAGAPIGSEMELEARYDPDGVIEIGRAQEIGVVKAVVGAKAGDTELSITLQPPPGG